MKRLLSVLLLVGFCLMSGCANTPDDPEQETNFKSYKTNIEEKYGSWEPWDYTPAYPTALDAEEAEKYDFEITMEQSIYIGVPETITYTVHNKTGETFEHFATFIERYEENVFGSLTVDIGFVGAEPWYAGWVRIPYWNVPYRCDYKPAETQFDLDLCDLQREYTYEPGYYRLAIFLPDGTHYAYFEIQ